MSAEPHRGDATPRPRSAVTAAALRVAGIVAVPIYFSIEMLVRLLNRGRLRPLTEAERALAEQRLPDVALAPVRLATPARAPIPHRAITLGQSIFVRAPALDLHDPREQKLLLHELVHVLQCQRLGRVGMAGAYGRGFADGFSYRNHVMEIEARDLADAAMKKQS